MCADIPSDIKIFNYNFSFTFGGGCDATDSLHSKML